MKQYILFNPLSGVETKAEAILSRQELQGEFETQAVDMTGISSYPEFFAGLESDARIVICGGDGTLNRFINDCEGIEIKTPLFYLPTGTGNDFYNDIKENEKELPVPLDKYIRDLPKVTVNGKTFRFLNNVGFGIDGYCCEVGDAMKAAGKTKVNYTSIAIKGLLYGFKRVSADITVDGQTRSFKNVWLAPAMNGRYYGGGMMASPSQDRLNTGHTVSLMVMFSPLKLKTLMVFPSIFKGEHVKHTEMVEQFNGHDITVKFDKPTALQIDGETILGVTEYHVTA